MRSLNQDPLPPDLERLLGEMPEHERQEMEHAWHLAGEMPGPVPDVETVDRAWKNVERRIRPNRVDRPAVHHAARRLIWAPVAVVTIVVVFLLWPHSVDIMVLNVPQGKRTVVMLADGSRVELNSATTLRYEKELRGRVRSVNLSGEAFFDVKKDGRPFVVVTRNARIEVLGTRFNVRARNDEGVEKTVVDLQSGKVRLTSENGGSAILMAGQRSSITGLAGGPTAPTPADTGVAVAWRAGGFAFNDEPLSTILAEVNRRFGVEATLDDSTIVNRRLTLHIQHAHSADDVLNDLCSYLGCTLNRSDTRFLLQTTR